MLLELEIKNFALIDQLNISFDKGLNILTGETGAGKSIIIDAVNMAIGERADRNFVRSGTNKCSIQAIFSIEDFEKFPDTLKEYGLNIEKEKNVIITREIYSNGRSLCRVNGVIVTQTVLKIITQQLIDIHGQHQHQSLLNSSTHIKMLDEYGGKDITVLVSSISQKYDKYQKLQQKLSSICFDEMERERKIDLIKFQINEIEQCELKPTEEEELNEQRKVLSNSERIYLTLSETYECIYGSNLNFSVLDKIASTVDSLEKISSIDDNLAHFHNVLKESQYNLQDITRDIRNYIDEIDFNENTLNNIELRLDLINTLKRKYGSSIQEILEFKESLELELLEYENNNEKIKEIKEQIDLEYVGLEKMSYELSTLRKKIAKDLEKKVINILNTLNMEKVQFEVCFNSKEKIKFTHTGIDQLEFIISTNPGEPLKPLSKIASGGEMSRIMLAFKTILANVDNIPTLIFDEIDTGISGRTAQIIGDRLYDISKHHQIICITHLPQIASMANHHYLIEKTQKSNKITTQVIKLEIQSRIEEIGRLLGGELTDITIKHAEEMIDKAQLRKA